MIKILFIAFFLTFSLSARENPFSPQKIIVVEPKIIVPAIEEKPVVKKEVNITAKREQKVEPIKPIAIKTTTISIMKEGKKTLVPVLQKKPVIVTAKPKPKKKKVYKRVVRSKLIYNGEFAKIRVKGKNIKITTHDKMLKHFILKNPSRLVVDFERFDVVQPFHKKVYGSKVKSLRVGHHDYFYRTAFQLGKNYRYKIKKQSYGYLIRLY
jgi:hypothetical protein